MVTNRKSPPRGSARARLLAAADELFSQNGIAATPVDEAVRRAGVATMTLYHHFDGKDAAVGEAHRRRDQLDRPAARHLRRARGLGRTGRRRAWLRLRGRGGGTR
jgi:AcrR family transcriptional regulator